MTERRRALTVVVAFGVVSLLGDIVYEGARSILGPFFLTLGASAAVVGFASGAGDFVGYVLRLVSGVVADRTRAYWPLTIAGYTMTVVAVPLLGWVGRVDLAVALVVAERLGKAIRSPARDTLLSSASRPLGSGFAFGLHEALDQTGARWLLVPGPRSDRSRGRASPPRRGARRQDRRLSLRLLHPRHSRRPRLGHPRRRLPTHAQPA